MHLTQKQAWNKQLIRYLAEQVVHEPITSLEKLPGCGCHNYEVNHDRIIKLPITSTIWESWFRQAIVLPIVQSHVSVQIPRIKIETLEMPEKTSLIGISYRKIPGTFVPRTVFESYHRARKIRILEQVSDFLTNLHTIDCNQIKVHVPDYNDRNCPFWQGMDLKRKKLHTFILKRLNTKVPPGSKNVLCHTDLHSENLCLQGDKLTGVLDFDFLIRANPATDFRPHLYAPKDMALLLEIHRHRSPDILDYEKIHRMRYFLSGFLTLAAVARIPCIPGNICHKLALMKLKKEWEQSR